MNNVKKYRELHRLSQTALAKGAGVSKQCVSYAEKHRVSVELAEKIAKYLNENVYDILGKDVLITYPHSKKDVRRIIRNIK